MNYSNRGNKQNVCIWNVIWTYTQGKKITFPLLSLQITSCLLTRHLSHLGQTSWMISVRSNVTYTWSYSSVTRVRLHGKNRAKINRTEKSPANWEHNAKVYCSCSISLLQPSACLSLSISFPHLCLSCTSLWFSLSLVTLHSPSGIQWWEWVVVGRLWHRVQSFGGILASKHS